MRPILIILALFAPCSAYCGNALVPATISGLPHLDSDLTPTAMALLDQAQMEVFKPNFEKARQLCAQAEALAPDHPLPLMLDVGCRLYEIMENIEAGIEDKKAYAEFYSRIDRVIEMDSLREKAFPLAPDPKLHLGAVYGSRGLIKLHQNSYLASYRDGKRGVEYLQKAAALDTNRFDAHMGLGQFEYYCARLNGLLQFMLDLQGDELKGIEKLKLAESRGTYAAWPARTFLIKILTFDRRDWTELEPLLEKVYTQFPENYHHVRMVATLAQGVKFEKPKSREWFEQACKRWDNGWRPPKYAKDFVLEPTRLELARYYAAKGRLEDARRHLNALTHSDDGGLAKAAQGQLSTLK